MKKLTLVIMTILIMSCAAANVERVQTAPKIKAKQEVIFHVVILFKACSTYLYAVVTLKSNAVYIIPLEGQDDNYIIHLKSLVPSANLIQVPLSNCA